MDTAFRLDNEGRANFLQILLRSTGCSYVCLWSCLPLSGCLCSIDGFYREARSSMQPSASAGTLAQRLFDDYRKSLFIVDNDHGSFPGFAFRNNNPCIEVKEEDLLTLASHHVQRQFYQEARIKVVFMGCQSGEIELGFSNISSDNAETLLWTLLPEDVSSQVAVQELPRDIEQQPNPPSSSSSLRLLSVDGPEHSSPLFNLQGSSLIPDPLKEIAAAGTDQQAALPQTLATTAPTTTIPEQLQDLEAFGGISNLRLPIPRNIEHEALTKAFLAVMSSPSSSTSSSQQQQHLQNLPGGSNGANPRGSAFRRYSTALLPMLQMKPITRRHDSMIKRGITYFRNLNLMRDQLRLQAAVTGNHAMATRLHHVMSERKRREKLKESLHALKALLPPGAKRDKASILARTREHLTSLQAQLEELRQRNAALEAKLPPAEEVTKEPTGHPTSSNPIDVQVRRTSESTSEDQTVDLQVTVRRECSSIQLVICILELLGQLNDVRLMSMDADTRVAETGAIITRVNMRLRIEGNGWDKSGFEEAVRGMVSDVVQAMIATYMLD